MISPGRVYATARAPYGRQPLALVAAAPAKRIVRVDRPADRACGRADASSRCRSGRASGSARCRSTPGSKLIAGSPARCRPLDPEAGVLRPHRLVHQADACTTSGAGSRDRHRHSQRCHRPHADRAELPARPASSGQRGPDARRRQGDQRRPRAQAARRAGRRHRARRWTHRNADHRGADRRGDPQRLRPHRAASRGRRPRSSTRPGARTPRSTSGGRTSSRTSCRCCSTSCTTSPAAPSSSCSPDRCLAASTTASTAS